MTLNCWIKKTLHLKRLKSVTAAPVENKPYLNPINELLQKASLTKKPSALIVGDPRFKLAVSGRGEVATPGILRRASGHMTPRLLTVLLLHFNPPTRIYFYVMTFDIVVSAGVDFLE